MKILKKINNLGNALKGYVYKWLVDLHLLNVPHLKGSCDIVVSLTSYGRRVADGVVYYTLVSLLRQKVQPTRIILWLADCEWKDETLPKRIKELKEKGVEVRYCKDIRSYKKLIPTITLCSNCSIMTVDDDIIYANDTLELIWKEHLMNPSAIICFNAYTPLIENGIPVHYSRWCGSLPLLNKDTIIFPVGCGGTLYPPGSLHNDVLREDLFMVLCPLADDIWFWFCGLLNETEKVFIKKHSSDFSFDALYQYFHRGSALTHSNRFECANDKQFKVLFDHYCVSINEEGILIPKEYSK